jgi:hypothetical protein
MDLENRIFIHRQRAEKSESPSGIDLEWISTARVAHGAAQA